MAFESPTYDEIVQAVLSYYDSSSPFWGKVNNGTATAAEIFDAYSRLPQFRLTRTIDGSVMGTDWSQSLNKLARTDYADPTERQQLVEQINDLFSNSRAANYGEGNAYNVNINGSWGGDGTTGYNVTSGAQITGSPNILATIADKASLAVTGVNIGAKLGAAIDRALYNIDPAWWDANYPTINPDTWPSIAGESALGRGFLRMLFGVKDTGVTAYVDERALAQTYQLLRDIGAFNSGGESYSVEDTTGLNMTGITQPIAVSNSPVTIVNTSTGSIYRTIESNISDVIVVPRSAGGNNIATAWISRDPFTVRVASPDGTYRDWVSDSYVTTKQGATFRFYVNYAGGLTVNADTYASNLPTPSVTVSADINTIAYIVLFGEHHQTAPVDGITPIGGTWQYPPTNITGIDLDTVLQQLKQEYPDLFTDTITESVLQDDGTVQDRTYVPVPWAVQQPITDTQTETEEETDPLIDTETQPTTRTETEIETEVDTDTFTDIVTRTPTNNPPDEGDGEQEPFVMPVGNASSLWAVYHPSQAQLNAFGAWLWSSNFVEQLL